MNAETMLEYVVRKLNDKAFNRAEIGRRSGVKASTMSMVASGEMKNPAHATVESLYQHFKSLAD